MDKLKKLNNDELTTNDVLHPILSDIVESIDSKANLEDIPDMPEMPEFPTEISVNNFPEIQKVEVLNFPKQETPIVNVKAPIVNVNVPDVIVPPFPDFPQTSVNINLDSLENALAEISDTLTAMRTNSETKNNREMVMQHHGYSSVNIKNNAGNNINPMTQPVNDRGVPTNLAVTGEGHLEVAIHAPRLPFGSVHTEKLAPIFQSDGVYGINTFSMITSTGLAVGTGSGSGSVTTSGNKLVCATGATQYSFASLQSRRRLRYKAGQGVVGRFTALFSTPVASGIQVAGFGTAETTLAFGYNGTSFGILYSTGGVREIHTFTITTASTATNDYVVTLPNTATVNVTATNNSSTTQTAYEISKGTFPGWKASARGSTIIFVADSAGNKSGSFSLAQTGAVTPAAGSDAETFAGASTTDTWIPQTTWNGDKLDGTGASGVTLDPSKGNVYQIGTQYLGFGAITFHVETATSNSNNPEFVTVHTIKYPNTSTSISLSQPSFPFLAAASSAGSTTDISVSVGSFAGFNEGEQINLGPRTSHQLDSTVTSSTSVFKPLFTIKNDREWKSRANQSVIHLLDVSGSANGNANATTKFYLVRDADLTGPVNFLTAGTNSCAYVDKAATGMSTPSDSQIVYTRALATSADFSYAFSDREITLQPGESITVAVKSLTATATCTGSLNTREDQ